MQRERRDVILVTDEDVRDALDSGTMPVRYYSFGALSACTSAWDTWENRRAGERNGQACRAWNIKWCWIHRQLKNMRMRATDPSYRNQSPRNAKEAARRCVSVEYVGNLLYK